MRRTLQLSILLFTFILIAQTPQRLSYQAVVSNASNLLVQNTVIGTKGSVLQGSVVGSEIYAETHVIATNANGLLQLEIGGGNVISGVFTNVKWNDGPYFVKTEFDLNGGTNCTISGTSQLLRVPYASLAEKVVKPTFSVYTSDDSTIFLPLTTKNFGVDDADILVTVPETGTYSFSFYSNSGNNNTYVMWVDTNYDGAGQVRIFNSSKSVELFKAPSIWVRFDQYAINASLRAYVPLNPASTIIKKLETVDVLKLQYRQDASENIGALVNS